MARTAFSQKFQNTCLICLRPPLRRLRERCNRRSMRMPVFSATRRCSSRVSVSSSSGNRSTLANCIACRGSKPEIGNDAVQPVGLADDDLQNWRCSSLRSAIPDSMLTEPAIEVSGLRISCAIAAASRPTAASRSCMRNFPLQTPDFGQIVKRVNAAHGAAAGDGQRGSHHPKCLAETIRRYEAHFAVGAVPNRPGNGSRKS